MRLSVIGNAGGGKSTLSKRLAEAHNLKLYEIDSILWQKGWQLTPEEVYNSTHHEIITSESWAIDGLGRQDSIEARLMSSTHIVLIDFPLWQHYWLAAERQISWVRGEIKNTPGGHDEMPPLQALFKTISEVESNWMPEIRNLVDVAASTDIVVHRVTDYQLLSTFSL